MPNLFYRIGLFYSLSLLILNAQDGGGDKSYIFVDSKDEIPDEQRLREAYFYVLLDYQKALTEGFTYDLELTVGDDMSFYPSQRSIEVEPIKVSFYSRAEVIANMGQKILWNDQFSKEELYAYQRMIRRSAEDFNELSR